MKDLKNLILENLVINGDIKENQQVGYNYHPKTKDELKELVNKLIEERGNDANLNDIDTSKITDMSELFQGSNFDGDISKWNVNNVKDMSYMFKDSKFNGDISNWDVRKVKDMSGMFSYSSFDGDISKWVPKSLKYAGEIYYKCPLDFHDNKHFIK